MVVFEQAEHHRLCLELVAWAWGVPWVADSVFVEEAIAVAEVQEACSC